MSVADDKVRAGSKAGEAEFSLSVSRALAILSSFRNDRPELGVNEIARELGLSKASVSRFLGALERHGYVERDPVTRRFRPGVEAFRVGNLFMSSGRLQRLALPLMQDLVAESGFTSYLTVRQQDAMVILAALEGPGPIKYSIPVGHRLPLHSSATGKAWLAEMEPATARGVVERIGLERKTATTITDVEAFFGHLAAIREDGYSLNWEENTRGVASVAAAARSGAGFPVAALSLGFAVSQVTRQSCRALGENVREAARTLEDQLRASA